MTGWGRLQEEVGMTERHLFLKGRSGLGKTTCLLSCLEPYWKGAGGFLTQRLTDRDGVTAGFRLLPVEGMTAPPSAAGPYESGLDGVFIEKTAEGWKTHPEVFETLGAELLDRLLKHPERYSFCYLDEIGGTELQEKAFMERLERLLHGPLPCFGVVKAAGNLAAMRTRLPLSADAAQERDRLEERLGRHLEGRVLLFTGEDREKREIRRFLEQRLAGKAAVGKAAGGKAAGN